MDIKFIAFGTVVVANSILDNSNGSGDSDKDFFDILGSLNHLALLLLTVLIPVVRRSKFIFQR